MNTQIYYAHSKINSKKWNILKDSFILVDLIKIILASLEDTGTQFFL